MAHKTLGRETTMMVFKFGANPLEEFPQEFWTTAKQMQFVWNDLVGMRNKLTDNFDRLKISGKDKVKERIKYWKEFDKIWREYLKSEEVKKRLGNDEREFLQVKFETADKRAKQEKTGLKKQFVLDRVYFRHRYSGGGKPLVDFQKQNSKGFNFLFPVEKHYQNSTKLDRKKRIGVGVFGVIKDRQQIFSFPFSAIIHREIPSDAIVKSVSWVGKRLKGKGFTKKHISESQRDWTWSIDVACEIPMSHFRDVNKKDFEPKSKVKIASLDVGWRLNEKEQYLRLGAMIDNCGNKLELRLPVNYQSNSARSGKLVSSIKGLINLDEQIGKLIQETKDELAKLGVKNLLKMRENGLFRLANLCTETGENQQALKILENFKAVYLPMRSIRGRSFDRMNKYRDWLYQNLASWLSKTYDVLIWEGQLNLKKMAESRKDLNNVETFEKKELEKRRRKSAKYRNYASIYGFRDFLKKAFNKNGKSIIDGETAYTSRTCSECGERVEKFHNIEFVCPNGHNFDRDFNASQNLLNQFIEQYECDNVVLEIPKQSNRDLSKIVVGL